MKEEIKLSVRCDVCGQTVTTSSDSYEDAKNRMKRNVETTFQDVKVPGTYCEEFQMYDVCMCDKCREKYLEVVKSNFLSITKLNSLWEEPVIIRILNEENENE